MRMNSVLDLANVLDQYLKKSGIRSPGQRLLTQFLEVVYFASLKTEEGKPLQLRISFVDPENPDPSRPPRPRADRWNLIQLANRLPFTVPNLVKLSKAADPWSSCLAVYFDRNEKFFVWALVDQTVHFNTMLVRETESGYSPPGIFHVLATGTADLTVYRERSFVGRLAQDSLLKHQNDVFWSGPFSDRLSGVERHIANVLDRLKAEPDTDSELWIGALAEKWIATLSRILISIQRYRHGGALLITKSKADLDIKYRINYTRLPEALVNLGVSGFRMRKSRNQIFDLLDNQKKSIPAALHVDEAVHEGWEEDFREEITGCVRFISALSCVDGVILATPDLSVKGFGVEIRATKDIDTVHLAQSPKAAVETLVPVDPNHYGTRHRSMMRYCAAHPKSIGFVISQDGEIRAMAKVRQRLVMWENLKVHSLWEQDFKKLARPASRPGRIPVPPKRKT
jgi:hypothetical protein